MSIQEVVENIALFILIGFLIWLTHSWWWWLLMFFTNQQRNKEI